MLGHVEMARKQSAMGGTSQPDHHQANQVNSAEKKQDRNSRLSPDGRSQDHEEEKEPATAALGKTMSKKPDNMKENIHAYSKFQSSLQHTGTQIMGIPQDKVLSHSRISEPVQGRKMEEAASPRNPSNKRHQQIPGKVTNQQQYTQAMTSAEVRLAGQAKHSPGHNMSIDEANFHEKTVTSFQNMYERGKKGNTSDLGDIIDMRKGHSTKHEGLMLERTTNNNEYHSRLSQSIKSTIADPRRSNPAGGITDERSWNPQLQREQGANGQQKKKVISHNRRQFSLEQQNKLGHLSFDEGISNGGPSVDFNSGDQQQLKFQFGENYAQNIGGA